MAQSHLLLASHFNSDCLSNQLRRYFQHDVIRFIRHLIRISYIIFVTKHLCACNGTIKARVSKECTLY